MPTATVYANRASEVSSVSGTTVQNPSSLHVAYKGASSSKETQYGVLGFNVPQSLWGKQAISATLTVPADGLGVLYADASALLFNSPNDLNVAKITYDDIHELKIKRSGLNDAGSSGMIGEGNRKQMYSSGYPGAAALMLNAILLLISLRGGSNKTYYMDLYQNPYITINYSDSVSIDVVQQTEDLGYRDPKKNNEFYRINFGLSIIGGTTVTAAKMKWKVSGASTYTETPLTIREDKRYASIDGEWRGKQAVWAPANTFPTRSTIEYQIHVQFNGKWWGNTTGWGTFSTVDATSTATPISPNNTMIDVESANVFKWKHNISTGSTPTGYDLQYSTDGHNWLPLASNKSTASLQYTVPSNKLPAGKLWWRVRTYNGDGIAGEWSNSAAIVGYGAPPTPVITSVSNTARPTVTWTSSTQIAYDLGIYQGETEILRTGETAGTAKTYVSPDFLEDGTYTAKLRIENSGLYWSKWATKNFTIRTSKPAAPSISGKSVKNGVIIISSNKGNGLFLLRDGIPIAKIINGQAEDYTAVGWHEYKIRLVSGAAFSDSAPLMLETKIDQAVIASADTPKNMIGPLLQSEKNAYPSTSNIASEMLFYAGRKYPVAVTTDDITEQFSPSFASLTPNQYERIKKKMESSTIVIYRNNGGECAYCLITNISPSRSIFFTSWGMTLSRVDYIERIDYDGV